MADSSTGFGDDRGASTTVAVVVLCGVTVILGATVAGGLTGLSERAEPTPRAAVSLSVDDETLTLTHNHGDPLDMRALRMVVSVDGEPLDHQPPLPFFSAAGFHPGPTGAFNSAGDATLRVGETAMFRVADTNDPTIEPGRTVSVTITADGRPVASLETSVESG